MAGAVPYRLLDEASWATQGCVLPSSALQSPSLLAGRLLLASVGAPALPRRPASPSAPTDWLGPATRRAGLRLPTQSTRLLLSSE